MCQASQHYYKSSMADTCTIVSSLSSSLPPSLPLSCSDVRRNRTFEHNKLIIELFIIWPKGYRRACYFRSQFLRSVTKMNQTTELLQLGRGVYPLQQPRHCAIPPPIPPSLPSFPLIPSPSVPPFSQSICPPLSPSAAKRPLETG